MQEFKYSWIILLTKGGLNTGKQKNHDRLVSAKLYKRPSYYLHQVVPGGTISLFRWLGWPFAPALGVTHLVFPYPELCGSLL